MTDLGREELSESNENLPLKIEVPGANEIFSPKVRETENESGNHDSNARLGKIHGVLVGLEGLPEPLLKVFGELNAQISSNPNIEFTRSNGSPVNVDAATLSGVFQELGSEEDSRGDRGAGKLWRHIGSTVDQEELKSIKLLASIALGRLYSSQESSGERSPQDIWDNMGQAEKTSVRLLESLIIGTELRATALRMDDQSGEVLSSEQKEALAEHFRRYSRNSDIPPYQLAERLRMAADDLEGSIPPPLPEEIQQTWVQKSLSGLKRVGKVVGGTALLPLLPIFPVGTIFAVLGGGMIYSGITGKTMDQTFEELGYDEEAKERKLEQRKRWRTWD